MPSRTERKRTARSRERALRLSNGTLALLVSDTTQNPFSGDHDGSCEATMRSNPLMNGVYFAAARAASASSAPPIRIP